MSARGRRRRRDVSKNRRHNERKIDLLLLFARPPERHLRYWEVALRVKTTEANAARQLTKLYYQGYIFRRKFKDCYRYRYLRPHGMRTAARLWARMQLRELTGEPISFNLKKRVPFPYTSLESKLLGRFDTWRLGLPVNLDDLRMEVVRIRTSRGVADC